MPADERRTRGRDRIVAGLSDRPAAAALVAAAAVGAFLVWALSGLDHDVSRLVRAGDAFADPAAVPPGLAVERGATGYDGQFYYRIALEPWSTERTAHGITFDYPALRHGRILYPLAAWALSAGGDPRLVPTALVLINLAAVAAIAWIAGRYAQALGRHAMWGTVIALYPGLLISVSRDLTEPLEIALVLAGLLLMRGGRTVAASLALTAAVLTRETAVVIVLALLALEAWRAARARSLRGRAVALLIPAGAFAAWQAALFVIWGQPPVGQGSINVAAPLAGLAGALATGPQRIDHLSLWYALLLFAAATAAVTALQLRRTSARDERWPWLMTSAFVACLDQRIWLVAATSVRALTEHFAVGALIVLGGTQLGRAALLVVTLVSWTLVALTRGGFD